MHPGSRGAAAPPAGARRRKCTAANSPSNHSGRAKTVSPAGRATGRRSRRGPDRYSLASAAAIPHPAPPAAHRPLPSAVRCAWQRAQTISAAAPSSSRFSVLGLPPGLPAGANPLHARRIALARQKRHPRIATQCGLVVEVFAAQREGLHALRPKASTLGSTLAGWRWSTQHWALRAVSPRRWPASRSSQPPAAELSRPPAQRPATAHRPRACTSSCSPVYWVC